LAKFLPGAGHGLLQPWAALVECNVAGCRNFRHFGVNADWRVLCCGKWLGCFLATQQWATDDGDVVQVIQLLCCGRCLLLAQFAQTRIGAFVPCIGGLAVPDHIYTCHIRQINHGVPKLVQIDQTQIPRHKTVRKRNTQDFSTQK